MKIQHTINCDNANYGFNKRDCICNQAQHTAGPWEVIKSMDEMERVYAGKSGSRFCVASINGEANAAFIVKAVNNFYQMLEALKFVQEQLAHDNIQMDVLDQAIAKAEPIAEVP